MPDNNNTIFRKKSLDRVSSPEQLNEYIKVASPGMWMVLLAIVVFLAGMLVWGSIGKLETLVKGAAVIEGGNAVAYVAEDDASDIEAGQVLRTDAGEYTVTSISQKPVRLAPGTDEYLLHAGDFEEGDWVYEVSFDAQGAADGTYECKVVTDSVTPLSFVMN